jgi:hypothetical protein
MIKGRDFHKIGPRRRYEVDFHIRVNLWLAFQDQCPRFQETLMGTLLKAHGPGMRTKNPILKLQNKKFRAPCAGTKIQLHPMSACPP